MSPARGKPIGQAQTTWNDTNKLQKENSWWLAITEWIGSTFNQINALPPFICDFKYWLPPSPEEQRSNDSNPFTGCTKYYAELILLNLDDNNHRNSCFAQVSGIYSTARGGWTAVSVVLFFLFKYTGYYYMAQAEQYWMDATSAGTLWYLLNCIFKMSGSETEKYISGIMKYLKSK